MKPSLNVQLLGFILQCAYIQGKPLYVCVSNVGTQIGFLDAKAAQKSVDETMDVFNIFAELVTYSHAEIVEAVSSNVKTELALLVS